jgi:hypothetical protein
LTTIARFIEIWEAEQRDNLTRDRDERLLHNQPHVVAETPELKDPVKEASDAEHEPKLNPFEEIEKSIEDYFTAHEEPDDEKKDFKAKQMRLQKTGAMFQTNESWKAELVSLTKMKVLKLPRVLQSIYYLNCFTKNEITLPNSQAFDWKIAKAFFIDELPKRMASYNVLGAKADKFESYQTINYCERIISELTQDYVDNYHNVFGKLFKWL